MQSHDFVDLDALTSDFNVLHPRFNTRTFVNSRNSSRSYQPGNVPYNANHADASTVAELVTWLEIVVPPHEGAMDLSRPRAMDSEA